MQELEAAKAETETSIQKAHRWKQRVTDSQQKCAQPERECEKRKNELLCLEGKLVCALSEVENEQRKRRRTEGVAQKVAVQLRGELDAAKCEVEASKKQVKESVKACTAKEGEVLLLEEKLVRAFAEACGEHSKRLRVEVAANNEAARLQSELEAAKGEVVLRYASNKRDLLSAHAQPSRVKCSALRGSWAEH